MVSYQRYFSCQDHIVLNNYYKMYPLSSHYLFSSLTTETVLNYGLEMFLNETIIVNINNIVVLILNLPPFWKRMALLRWNMQQLTEIKMAFKTMYHSSKKILKSLFTDRSLVKENYTEHKRWTKYCIYYCIISYTKSPYFSVRLILQWWFQLF